MISPWCKCQLVYQLSIDMICDWDYTRWSHIEKKKLSSSVYLAYFLTCYLTFCHAFWHSIWHMFRHAIKHSIWHLFWHSIWHLALSVKVQQCPLRSGARGWKLAVPEERGLLGRGESNNLTNLETLTWHVGKRTFRISFRFHPSISYNDIYIYSISPCSFQSRSWYQKFIEKFGPVSSCPWWCSRCVISRCTCCTCASWCAGCPVPPVPRSQRSTSAGNCCRRPEEREKNDGLW